MINADSNVWEPDKLASHMVTHTGQLKRVDDID
jgi:hypothetical protein